MQSYPISNVIGSLDAPGDVILQLAWGDGEEFQLSMSADVAAKLVIAAQDAASDCERKMGRKPTPVIADRVFLQASSVPGRAILSVQSETGLNLHYLIPDEPIVHI